MADMDEAPEAKRLARSARLEAVIERLKPIVWAEAIGGIKITKTDAKWIFSMEGFDDLKARVEAIEGRLANMTATATCNEDGTITITFTA